VTPTFRDFTRRRKQNRRKYKQNRRGKAATAFTAAIHVEFAKRRLSTTFLDSAVVSTARSSCKMTPAELRERRNIRSSCPSARTYSPI
jgi:hypothetical protein